MKLTIVAKVVIDESEIRGREVSIEPRRILRDPHQHQITQIVASMIDDVQEDGGDLVCFDIETDEAIA